MRGGAEAVAVSGGGGGPSLDLGKNNSTKPESGDDDRYDCRVQFDDMFFRGPDGDEAEYRCNQWDCYCCGYRMRMNLIEEIKRITAQRPEMCRMLTLTLDPDAVPADPDDQHEYITERWNALRTRLKREIGDFSYIWVREEQASGLPHLHAIVSRFLPQETVATAWAQLGGGEIVDIRRVENVQQTAHYLGKYLTKDALSGFPDGIRRYGSSADLSLSVRDSNDSATDWRLLTDDEYLEGARPVVKGDFVRD